MQLKHPTIPGATKNVPDDIAEKWLANGWTEVKPKSTTPAKKRTAKKSAPKPSDD